LVDKKLNANDLLAGIIDLAIKGFLKIEVKKKKSKFLKRDIYNYSIYLSKSIDEIKKELKNDLEKDILYSLFKTDYKKAEKIKRHGYYQKISVDTLLKNINFKNSKKVYDTLVYTNEQSNFIEDLRFNFEDLTDG
jgi:hypothetical protein